MTRRRIPPEPVITRLPDQAIRITVGIYTSTVSSEHLVPERVLQLQRRTQRHGHGKGSRNGNSRWTEATVREMRRLHLLERCTLTEIAARFETCDSAVSRIVRWKDWAHCDHDLRSLPRPDLRRRGPVLTPEEQEASRKRRREYLRRYDAQRRQRRAQQALTCVECAHHDPKGCGLEIPEARNINYASRCAAFMEAS